MPVLRWGHTQQHSFLWALVHSEAEHEPTPFNSCSELDTCSQFVVSQRLSTETELWETSWIAGETSYRRFKRLLLLRQVSKDWKSDIALRRSWARTNQSQLSTEQERQGGELMPPVLTSVALTLKRGIVASLISMLLKRISQGNSLLFPVIHRLSQWGARELTFSPLYMGFSLHCCILVSILSPFYTYRNYRWEVINLAKVISFKGES